MLRLRKKLHPESWLREGLGIWDEDGADVFAGAWPEWLTDESPDRPPSSIAVACSVELTHSAIVAATVDADDQAWVRPLKYAPGTQWAIEDAARYAAEFDATVVVDGGGPAKVLVPGLEAAGVDLRVAATPDVLDSCAEFFTLVTDGRVRHRGDAELDAAVRAAVKRPVGDRWAWGRRKSAGDVSVLEAATLAAWDALHSESGPSVFIARPRRRVLVVGSRAEDVAAAYGDDVEVWSDATKPHLRDRYRAKHDARVVIAIAPGEAYVPSKYAAEELDERG